MMTRHLLLHFASPMMSFGGVQIDNKPTPNLVPTCSMITGLIANALGYDRRDILSLQALQDGLQIACAVVDPGRLIEDYQTADLSTPWMGGSDKRKVGWVEQDGTRMVREGSEAALEGRRQQWRSYIADADIIVAAWGPRAEPSPGFDAIAAAFDAPARTLYLGKANCPPVGDICLGIVNAGDARAALTEFTDGKQGVEFHLPVTPQALADAARSTYQVAGRRDWMSDRHCGLQTFERVGN